MVFTILSTIVIGIIGGIISSITVSRVFLIQDEYRNQLESIRMIVRKLGAIAAMLDITKATLELSFDESVNIKKAIQKNDYKSQVVLYGYKEGTMVALNDVFNIYREELKKTVDSVYSDISNLSFQDNRLRELVHSINDYMQNIRELKEFTFSGINPLISAGKEVMKQYNDISRHTGKTIIKRVIKDKIMIIVFSVIGILIIGVIISYYLGI